MGDKTERTKPTKVPGLTGVKQLTASSSHSLALLDDGTISFFGRNSYGQ